MDKERFIALHEAGHTVMSVRMNSLVGNISIVEGEINGLSGFAEDEACNPTNEVEARDCVSILCAGYAALVAAGLGDETARRGACGDFEAAQAILERFDIGPLNDWLVRTVETMRLPENVVAVEQLANELVERKKIDGDFAVVLVDLADDGMSASDPEFLAYLQQRGLKS